MKDVKSLDSQNPAIHIKEQKTGKPRKIVINKPALAVMSDLSHHIYLTKVDPNANQYRYYSLRIDPDLFGQWSLFRHQIQL